MNEYSTSALVAFVLVMMGYHALTVAWNNIKKNKFSKPVLMLSGACTMAAVWDFGYAWMSLCYYSEFAYIPRAIALLGVVFYMFFILQYVAIITEFPTRLVRCVVPVIIVSALIAWYGIIQKNTVEFQLTHWGYWYIGSMNPYRILQFVGIFLTLVCYYCMVDYGIRHAKHRRQKQLLSVFRWFGVILMSGFILDVIVPIFFKKPAMPGSAVGAFFSVMLLYVISKKYREFGISKDNVAEYVFDDVSMPVVITDENNTIVLHNNNLEDYLAIDSRKIVGKKIYDFFTMSDVSEEKRLEAWDTDEKEYMTEACKGLKISKLHKNIIRDEFGEILYVIFFVQDMTKEQELMERLEESRAQAEEASLAKSNFLANMSHEIRTPMNSIIGMCSIILQEDDTPKPIKRKVEQIRMAGTALLAIINDILDLSKIESGKYELINDTYDMPSLIYDVSSMFNVRVQDTKVRFEVTVDDTLPAKLVGDVKRIRQILINILGNAVKFTREGKISWDITWNHDVENPEFVFAIKDTGIGIKPEDMDKIFGAFNQVDTRRNRNVEGTGLGLAISKYLAEMMDGSLQVDSIYGEGSEFKITVKQTVSDFKPIGSKIASSLHKQEYLSTSEKSQMVIREHPDARILIVDDNKMNLVVAKGIMKPYNMKIDTAMGGLEAVEKVQQNEYDLVFMDHMMPEYDGVDTTRMIRDLGGKYKTMPIVALTANALNESRKQLLSAGMQDFLAKPIEKKELDRIINRWLP